MHKIWENRPEACESVDQERIRGMPHRCGEELEGGARTAIEGAETLTLLELAE